MEMRSGLPVGVAAFVGRGLERAKVTELVADARVVTLTGSGGCGKTRLAVEVAGDVASRFADGAWWVDLQGVSEAGMVAAAGEPQATLVGIALDGSPGADVLQGMAIELVLGSLALVTIFTSGDAQPGRSADAGANA